MTRATEKVRLWTRELVLASLVNLFLAFVFYMLMTTMALYAVEQFSASHTTGGLASSMFVLGSVIARLFAGNLVDLIGHRRILVVSLAVFLVASVAYLPVDSTGSIGWLFAVRALHGAAFGVASTAAMSIAQALIPASRRAEGTGYFTLSTTLATAIGPALAVVLVHGSAGYTGLFVAGIIAAGLGMVTALLLRAPDRMLDAEQRARLRRFHPRDMLHPAVVPVASTMFVLAVCYSGVLTFLDSFAVDRGLQTGASLFFVAYAIVLFGSRLVAGKLQDRRGDNIVVYIAITGFVIGMLLLSRSTTDLAMVVAGGFIGLGWGTLMSALQSVAASLVPVQRTGVAISTHFFMVDLGAGFGPIVLGALLNRLGYGQMYLLLAGLVALSALLYHLVHGRTENARVRAAVSVPATGSTEPLVLQEAQPH